MDKKGTKERRENRIISAEFKAAIEEVAEQPRLQLAAEARVKLSRLPDILKRDGLDGLDIYPLCRLARIIEFEGILFEGL